MSSWAYFQIRPLWPFLWRQNKWSSVVRSLQLSSPQDYNVVTHLIWNWSWNSPFSLDLIWPSCLCVQNTVCWLNRLTSDTIGFIHMPDVRRAAMLCAPHSPPVFKSVQISLQALGQLDWCTVSLLTMLVFHSSSLCLLHTHFVLRLMVDDGS